MLHKLLPFVIAAIAVAQSRPGDGSVSAEESSKFNASYGNFILLSFLFFVFFALCGASIRLHCTTSKGRTNRGILTGMLLPEDL
ncbi:hypothetical protein ScalyP_jg8718 [Parmales sp. scaly parma]|nr:hypothetical protein ScalyP_jg8718 [Parmales sp. scaly parma]